MKIEARLPSFPGFYNSILDFDIERVAEDFAYVSVVGVEEELLNLKVPQITKKIKQSNAENKEEQIQQIWDDVQSKVDFADILTEVVDYEKYYLDVSKIATEYIESELKSLGIVTSIDFMSIASPSQYNYGSDEVDIVIDLSDENKKNIIQYISDHEAKFENYIEDHFTSRDDFISFIENGIESWTEEYLFGDEADRTVSAFLEFVLENEDINYDYVTEDIVGSEYIDYEKMSKEIEKALSLTESLTFKKFLKQKK